MFLEYCSYNNKQLNKKGQQTSLGCYFRNSNIITYLNSNELNRRITNVNVSAARSLHQYIKIFCNEMHTLEQIINYNAGAYIIVYTISIDNFR